MNNVKTVKRAYFDQTQTLVEIYNNGHKGADIRHRK